MGKPPEMFCTHVWQKHLLVEHAEKVTLTLSYTPVFASFCHELFQEPVSVLLRYRACPLGPMEPGFRALGRNGASGLCSPHSVQPEDLPFLIGILCRFHREREEKALPLLPIKFKSFFSNNTAWTNFLFDVLVKASNWKYSRCLLGIHSAKLTWRSCHGSYEGMALVSSSVGE